MLLGQNAKRRSRKNSERDWLALRARRRLREENGSGFGIMQAGAGVLRHMHIIFALTAGRVGEKDVHLHAIPRARIPHTRKKGTRILDALYIRMRCNKSMLSFIYTHIREIHRRDTYQLCSLMKSQESLSFNYL